MSENKPNLEIEFCIKTLQELVEDTNIPFELPDAQSIALYKSAGELSSPNRDEFQRRRKDAKKAVTIKIYSLCKRSIFIYGSKINSCRSNSL
jgi:hypothetical protein